MDLTREWTRFALDAEVEAYGTKRISEHHNELRRQLASANERANTYLAEMVRFQEQEREFERAREAWKHVVIAHLMDTNDDEIEAEHILDAYFNPAKEG